MLSTRLLPLLILAPSLVQSLALIKPRVTGNEQEDDDVCSNYRDCSAKGLTYWNTLHTTLSQPEIVDRDDLDIFEEHYFAEYESTMVADPDFRQDLEKRNIDSTDLDGWEVSGYNPDTEERDAEVSYYNLFETHGGVIVAEGNWRYTDSQKALPWSEIMYQTWQLAEEKANELAGKDHPPGGPISNLQSIVQHIITNKGTRAVMKAAYEASGLVPGYDRPDQWRKWTEQDTPYLFYGLLGTDNVRGAIWLLNDHANKIGRKEISVVWSRWSMGSPDIWYVLWILLPLHTANRKRLQDRYSALSMVFPYGPVMT
ncbi:MAG: hypothetical protein Q9222_001583 [Ikaeria aurantiellina]